MTGILVLTAGVVTCLYEGSSVDGSLKGIIMSLTSTLCGAAMLSFSGAVLDQTEKMDPVRLNFYSAPVAVAVSHNMFPWLLGAIQSHQETSS